MSIDDVFETTDFKKLNFGEPDEDFIDAYRTAFIKQYGHDKGIQNNYNIYQIHKSTEPRMAKLYRDEIYKSIETYHNDKKRDE